MYVSAILSSVSLIVTIILINFTAGFYCYGFSFPSLVSLLWYLDHPADLAATIDGNSEAICAGSMPSQIPGRIWDRLGEEMPAYFWE